MEIDLSNTLTSNADLQGQNKDNCCIYGGATDPCAHIYRLRTTRQMPYGARLFHSCQEMVIRCSRYSTHVTNGWCWDQAALQFILQQ